MKAETREWIAKADGDFFDAGRGVRARKNFNHDGVCFHAQQCIEKYLKARMIEAAVEFPKTHDLVRLLDLILTCEPSWEMWRAELDVLTDYAVSFRYPAESATAEEAQRAFRICKTLRSRLRVSLGLEVMEPVRKRARMRPRSRRR